MRAVHTAEQDLAKWQEWITAGRMPQSLQTPAWRRTCEVALATLRTQVTIDQQAATGYLAERRRENDGGPGAH